MALWNVFLVAFVGALIAVGFVILGRRMWLDHVRLATVEVNIQNIAAWIQSVQQANAPKADGEKKLKSVK